MKKDITETIARLIIQSTPEDDDRLHYHAEALEDSKCTSPVLGRLIDSNDVKYLFSAFALPDRAFAEKFPTLSHLSSDQRQRISDALNTHMEYCTHCSLKRSYDLELDDRIKKTCQSHSGLLLQLMDEEESGETDESAHGFRILNPILLEP